jgi:hypothetical protein
MTDSGPVIDEMVSSLTFGGPTSTVMFAVEWRLKIDESGMLCHVMSHTPPLP